MLQLYKRAVFQRHSCTSCFSKTLLFVDRSLSFSSYEFYEYLGMYTLLRDILVSAICPQEYWSVTFHYCSLVEIFFLSFTVKFNVNTVTLPRQSCRHHRKTFCNLNNLCLDTKFNLLTEWWTCLKKWANLEITCYTSSWCNGQFN